MNLLRIIKTKREVKAQRQVVSYLTSINVMYQSEDITNAISATNSWLDNRVKSAKLSR